MWEKYYQNYQKNIFDLISIVLETEHQCNRCSIKVVIFKDKWIDGVKSVQNLPRQPPVFVGKCLIVSDKSPAEALPRESVRVKNNTI